MLNEIYMDNLRIFASAGTIKKGHFVYKNGRHGTIYVDAKPLFSNPKAISKLCYQIAERFEMSGVNVVTGPAENGNIVAGWVASHLSRFRLRKVDSVPTIKTLDNDFFIRPSFRRQIFSRKVLVVEDVLTTGSSARKVVDVVRSLGGNVVGLGALYNRGGKISMGALGVQDSFVLVNVSHQSWSAVDCPQCKNGIPVDLNLDHGREFMMRKQASVW
ncbi:MAG: phosphoribosyltransferase family protein [Patescibacteria group bacterium]